MRPRSAGSSTPVFLLFILSGLTSLVYEIVWSRILSTILGNTSLAISIIVCIFLGGLGIGSYIGARVLKQLKNPLLLYSGLEIFIGLYSLFTPRITVTIESIYAGYYMTFSATFILSVLLKSGLAACLLLLPTIAMGATLPLLISVFPPEERPSRAGLLYGLNTAGAVIGTLLAGYFFLPTLGITKTIQLAAALNGLVGLFAVLLSRRSFLQPEIPSPILLFNPLYLLAVITGFASICYEVLWTRALSMFFGSSVYAFSAILAAFLLGIASGSSFYAKRIPEVADPYQFFSLIQFRLSLSAIFFLGVFMGVPFLLIRLFETSYQSFALFQTGQFLIISCTIFYSTFLSGAAFPAILHFFRGRPEWTQAHAGYIYSYNTMGSILGSFCAGFLLIPLLGVERSIRLVALLNLLLGVYCFRKSRPAHYDKRILAIGGVSLLLLLILPPWNKSIYNGGFYAFAYRYVSRTARKPSSKIPSHSFAPDTYRKAGLLPLPRSSTELHLLYYREGLTATVAVIQDDKTGARSLLINGKPDASNIPTGDMRTQLLLGHLPALLKGEVREGLVIGLGSGVTAGALSTHRPLRIDCVEIEKSVAGALPYYEAENFGIWQKENFHLIFDDGRNVVQHTSQLYDIITSEPSNLWMSGVANLFTQEFFQAAQRRLRPGGIMCQWIHLYQISRQDVWVFLKTFHSVFPHLSIWVDDSDMLVLGSDHSLELNPATLTERMSEPEVRRSLERSNLTPDNLTKRYVSDERIVRILKASIPLNTDDHPILEFSAPRSLFWDRSGEIAAALYELKRLADLNLAESENH